jgi:hypothetical protein
MRKRDGHSPAGLGAFDASVSLTRGRGCDPVHRAAEDASNAARAGRQDVTFAEAQSGDPSAVQHDVAGRAGSDFRTVIVAQHQLLHQYDLSLVATEQRDGHAVYTVDAIPHDNAPVVGVRRDRAADDFVLLARLFRPSMTPLKRLRLQVKPWADAFATRMRMRQLDNPAQWTEIVYETQLSHGSTMVCSRCLRCNRDGE